MTGHAARPWMVGIVAALAAAGGVHAGLAIDHGGDAQGVGFASAAGLQVLLAVLLALQPTQLVRLVSLGALVTPAIAWLVTRTSVAGDDGAVLGLGLGVAVVELVAAAVLWALPARPGRVAAARGVVVVPALAVLGIVAVGVVPAGHDHHAPPASAASPTDAPSIFGDLFAGHDAGHDH